MYGIYNDYTVEDTDDATYCDPALYSFAFWSLSLCYILFWTGLVIHYCVRFILFTCCSCILGNLTEADLEAAQAGPK